MQNQLSVYSNEARLKIIKCLSQGDKKAGELEKVCGLSQSAVSQHLAKLRKFGIVHSEKKGKEMIYSLKLKEAAWAAEILLNLESK